MNHLRKIQIITNSLSVSVTPRMC